ncbi:MAG: aminotransferase class I/II-fold pyridoxal phosphate-dependent enzyme [Asticcacaulis sp.]
MAPHILLVIDEAYAEFVDEPTWESAFEMARGLDNMVVTRTFSKIHGLAGLRVGFGYCSEPVIAAIDRIRLPFNVNGAWRNTPPSPPCPTRPISIASKAQVARLAAAPDPRNPRPRLRCPPVGRQFRAHPFQGPRRGRSRQCWLMSQGLIVRHVANYGLPAGLARHRRQGR